MVITYVNKVFRLLWLIKSRSNKTVKSPDFICHKGQIVGIFFFVCLKNTKTQGRKSQDLIWGRTLNQTSKISITCIGQN